MNDVPICKICLESGGLLTDVCGCRGTVGGMHLRCLKQTVRYEQTCSVCKSPYTYKVLHPMRHGQPLFWHVLGSPICEILVWAATAFTFKFFHFKVVLTAQLILLVVYTIAYIPLFTAWLSDPVYRWKWMRQWLRCAFITTGTDGRKIMNTPFPAAVAYFLIPLVPGSLALSYTYNKLWHVHMAIVGEIMNAEEAEDITNE